MLFGKESLSKVVFASPEEERRGYQLLYIMQALLLSIFITNVVILFFDWQHWPQMLTLDICFPAALLAYYWVRQGKVRRASQLGVAWLWLLLTIFVVWTDGIRGPAFFAYVAVILVAGLLLGARAETAVLLLSLVVATAIFISGYLDWLSLPLTVSPPAANWIGGSICLVFVSYIVRLTLADLRKVVQQEQQISAQNVLLKQQAEEQAQKLAQANAQLQELDALKSKFVRDMTHELRTPLTNFKLYLDLWEMAGEEKKGQYLAVLKEQSNRLTRLVDGILRIAKLDAGYAEAEVGKVSLNDLVRQVGDAYEGQLRVKGVGLTLTLADDLPLLCVAQGMILEVMDQLMLNAVQYTQVGEIGLRTFFEPEEGLVCFAVRDSGIGIAEKDFGHIFERFYRGTNVGELALAGTGLGLTLAQRIVEMHQGEIRVESAVGQGSLFTMCLPLRFNSC